MHGRIRFAFTFAFASTFTFLFVGLVTGCATREAPGRIPVAHAESRPLPSFVHPVAIESDDFRDLAFLKEALAGKRIVQLGENTHGVREYNLLKSRIVRYLHRELGYDVLAFESPLYQCYDANLTAGEAPAFSMTAKSTLAACAIGVWHTTGVLPLFEYLRETQETDRPLRLAGFDVQPIGSNKKHRPDFLRRVVASVDSVYAGEVYSLDSTFLTVYALGGRDRRAWFRDETGRRMEEAYAELAAFLDRYVSGDAADERLLACQTARSMVWYIRQQAATTARERFECRDEGMARNLAFLLDEFYPGRKVIVWAHNAHIRHANEAVPRDSTMYPDEPYRVMGGWIHERYGDEVYTVGLYAHRGGAADNRGEVFDIAPAGSGTLEARLHEFGREALFLDLSAAPRSSGSSWIDRPIAARQNGTEPLLMTIRDQYDAILFVDEVSPRVSLY